MSSRKGIAINVAIFATIIIGYITVTFFFSNPEPKSLSFESAALQVELKPLARDAGKSLVLRDLRGKSVLLHFWASWCKPCDADRGTFLQLARAYSNSSVQMVGIATSDTQAAIKKSGKLEDTGYPQYLDEAGKLALALGVKTLPQTLLIDAQGRVLSHFRQPIGVDQIKLLQEQMASLTGVRGGLGTVPEFTLDGSEGRPVSRTALEKKVWVADFIFTSCKGICPTLTAKMRKLQEDFKTDDRVKLVSISVDPDTDTPEVMKNYGRKHDADPAKWYFLTGKLESIKKLLVEGFRLGTMDNPEFHSGRFILVDQANSIRGYYDPDLPDAFEKLRADIAQLLR